MRTHFRMLASTLVLLSLVSLSSAQKPKAAKLTAAVKSDTVTLFVDASETPRKILHTGETIPAIPGAMTLYYPKWIPGEHGPTGPINDLAGLHFTAGGKEIPWRRDLLDMYTFHLTVPAGATSVEATLDYLLPASGSFTAGGSSTEQMFVLSWNQVLLYPAGFTARQIMFQPNLRLPAGWKFGTALDVVSGGQSANIEFQTVPLETLIDSPVIAGRYFAIMPLIGDPLRHQIDVAADSAEALLISPENTQKFSNLVAESGALFGARHYQHYDFLLSLSDHVAHFGLEHHQSSDDRVNERSLVDEDARRLMAHLLPHEMVHSWNGKYRRPADLATPDYQKPMQTDLLWVYEGLTEYLGFVLTGRSQLLGADDMRDDLATTAATLDHRTGRTWRPLQDTADAAQALFNASDTWTNWRRSVDFYDESLLIWLEADTVIRQQTGGKKSLDDFTHLFHGGKNTSPEVVPYTFDDVVAAMNQVTPYDWRKFFTDRLTSTGPHAPLGGVTNGGWKLEYSAERGPLFKTREDMRHFVDLSYSIGLEVSTAPDDNGAITDVWQGSPAAKAGIGPGMRVVAVNGRAWSPEVLRSAVAATKGGAPLELLLENNEYFKTYKVEYAGGAMYPHLVRDESKPDVLSEILKPHAAAAAK
jgi:predicted metalloprotease with PDZ domain